MPTVKVNPAANDGARRMTLSRDESVERHCRMTELQQVYARDYASQVRNAPPESLWSRFLYLMLRANVPTLVAVPLIGMLLMGIAFGLISSALECHDGGVGEVSIGDHALLAFGSLVGNHFMEERVEHHQPECTFMVGLEGYVGLVIQAVLFGALVNRVMTPPANQLELTDQAVVKVRDGDQWFSVLACHRFGRSVRDVVCKAVWLKPSLSTEGEKYVRIVPLEMSAAPLTGVLVPTNFNHIVDESSPLHGLDLLQLPGLIMVRVTGFDSAVRADVEVVSYYRKEDITTRKRADMIDRDRFYMKLREGERDGFNYANFNSFRE